MRCIKLGFPFWILLPRSSVLLEVGRVSRRGTPGKAEITQIPEDGGTGQKRRSHQPGPPEEPLLCGYSQWPQLCAF